MAKKSNRNNVIERAKELIQENPGMSRRDIEAQLKHELGQGLRSSEILKLKKQISTQPYSKTLADKNTQRLIEKGLLPEEAKFYVKMGIPLSHTGFKKTINYRKREIEHAKKAGIKNVEKYIRDSYASAGWVDKDGTIRPDFYNERVYSQLSAPRKERKRTVLIEPDNYRSYQKLIVKDKFSASDAAHMASVIPTDQWAERMTQYKYLRKCFFSHVEAYQKITATSKNKEGSIVLQSLNLNDPLILQEIQERINFANKRIKEARGKGMSYWQARKLVSNEIYGKTKNNDPNSTFGWLKEYYKFESKNKPTTDFDAGLRARARKMEKKKMLYKARK